MAEEMRAGMTDVVEALRFRLGERPVARLAEELGVTRQYLSDVLAGKREPGPKILAAVGVRKRVVYETDAAEGGEE